MQEHGESRVAGHASKEEAVGRAAPRHPLVEPDGAHELRHEDGGQRGEVDGDGEGAVGEHGELPGRLHEEEQVGDSELRSSVEPRQQEFADAPRTANQHSTFSLAPTSSQASICKYLHKPTTFIVRTTKLSVCVPRRAYAPACCRNLTAAQHFSGFDRSMTTTVQERVLRKQKDYVNFSVRLALNFSKISGKQKGKIL